MAKPIKETPILHSKDAILRSLAATGVIRLPVKAGKVVRFDGISIKGKSITETIVEERR